MISTGELQLTKQLMDSLQGVAIVTTDTKLNVQYANEYAANIFGLTTNAATKLPRTVQNQLKKQLPQADSPILLTYQFEGTVRSLQVFHQQLNVNTDNAQYVLHMHDITARIGVETKLRQTEQLLRNVINTSPDFITVKDERNHWLLSNNSALSLFKIPKNQYQFQTDAQILTQIDPVFKEAFRQLKELDAQAWQSDYSVQQQVTIQMPTGGEKVFEVFKVALYNEDRSRQGILTLGRDITENKLAEHHLKDRSAILDALIHADWLLNSEANWHTVTPKVLAQIGEAARFSQVSIFQNRLQGEQVKSSDRTLMWRSSVLAPHKRTFKAINYNTDAFQDWHKQLLQGQAVYGTVQSLPKATANSLKRYGIKAVLVVPIFCNSQWWGEVIVERHHEQSPFSKQEVGALMAMARSLGGAIEKESTGEHIAQAQIAFDSASEGIVITDADTNITAVNQGFTNITGFTEAEVLGKNPHFFTTGSHQLWDAINKKGKWRGETKSIRKSGEEYQELLTLTAVKNKQGNVINYVAVFSDISEIKASQNKLNKLVNHDALTGLPNRRLLNELLDHALKRGLREQHQIATLFIDLDRFKSVNDSLGHQVGDELLIQVSTRINECIRESDVVARLGGDEFLVMMNTINQQEDAALVAQKIIQTLQREFIISGKEIYIGASIGIAISDQQSQEADELIKAADTAMYHVKNNGKNHYCIYTPDLDTHAIEQFNLETQLRHAITADSFSLLYQPQYSIVDGKIIGAEALLRWEHEELGLLSPDAFIHLAEETGLIIPIGQWVIKEVMHAMVGWQEAGLSLETVAINVSTAQVIQGNFVDTIYGSIVETDCDPSMIELEITESTVMQNTEYVIDTLKQIKKLGIGLAIDDFGIGYSSLINLKRLPLDKIKIDQSFVQNLPNDLDDAVIATTINGMAKSLGLEVIAEGVESQEQAEFLTNIGCQHAQGYHFSRPLNFKDFTALLTHEQLNRKHDH